MIPLAYACYSRATTRPVLNTLKFPVQFVYETGVADLVHDIVASGQCKLTLGTQAVPASTVLTNIYDVERVPLHLLKPQGMIIIAEKVVQFT
jgi:hypothetical protein